MGGLYELCVRSDGSGPGPAWHLQEVAVTDSQSGISVSFPAFRWLDAKSGLEAILKVRGCLPIFLSSPSL